MPSKIRTLHFGEEKRARRRLALATAWDYPTGLWADRAGLDGVLVGDSLGNVALGYRDTIPVTLEDMIHHTAAVARGLERALLIADMPFMTYKISPEQALGNAARLVQEGGAEAVKIEGGHAVAPAAARLVEAGIPVMGHLGLTLQSVHSLGGYRVQGRGEEAAERLLADARALESAGCFALVAECLPPSLGERMAQSLSIPVIGIGAGAGCDGQVLVLADLLGLTERRLPRFVKQYARLGEEIQRAVGAYVEDVREGRFPAAEHCYEE